MTADSIAVLLNEGHSLRSVVATDSDDEIEFNRKLKAIVRTFPASEDEYDEAQNTVSDSILEYYTKGGTI